MTCKILSVMLIVKSVMKAGEISTKDDFKTAIEKERTASEMKINGKKCMFDRQHNHCKM